MSLPKSALSFGWSFDKRLDMKNGVSKTSWTWHPLSSTSLTNTDIVVAEWVRLFESLFTGPWLFISAKSSPISFCFFANSMSRISHALFISFRLLTWSVHYDPLGMALRKRWSCSSLSWSYFNIQCLISFFHVAYVFRNPSHDGTGNLSRPLTLGLVAMVSTICLTASATASRTEELSTEVVWGALLRVRHRGSLFDHKTPLCLKLRSRRLHKITYTIYDSFTDGLNKGHQEKLALCNTSGCACRTKISQLTWLPVHCI